MLIIVFGIIFLLNFYFQILKRSRGIFFISIISLCIFYVLLLGVKETADSDAYIFFFENSEVKTDFLFRYLSILFYDLGLGYYELFQFHVLLFGLLFIIFVTRFTSNIFLVLIFYLLILYVPLVNQIRYYLAFGFFLNAIYFFYFTKKRCLAYILIGLSILSHSAIILFYGFIILNAISTKKNYIKRCFVISVLFLVLIFSLNTFGLYHYIGGYESYLSSDATGSIAGGIYNILPYVILLTLLQKRSSNALKKHQVFKDDQTFQILYRLSFYSIIFILASLKIQILAHRYVHASLIIWLCFYCYTLFLEKSFKVYFNHIISITIVIIGLFYYTYFFSEIVLGQSSTYLVEFIKSFNSIKYLPNIEL